MPLRFVKCHLSGTLRENAATRTAPAATRTGWYLCWPIHLGWPINQSQRVRADQPGTEQVRWRMVGHQLSTAQCRLSRH